MNNRFKNLLSQNIFFLRRSIWSMDLFALPFLHWDTKLDQLIRSFQVKPNSKNHFCSTWTFFICLESRRRWIWRFCCTVCRVSETCIQYPTHEKTSCCDCVNNIRDINVIDFKRKWKSNWKTFVVKKTSDSQVAF